MKNYEWILFDADETLFHFDSFAGLQLMFSRFDIQFTEQDYLDYQNINKPLWIEYQNHKITAEQLQHRRFNAWGEKLQIHPGELNSAFLSAMADICKPIDGAIALLNAIKDKVKLGIITNGFTKLQQIRLERTGLRDRFEFIVISEEVGVAKPHPEIFNHALKKMNDPKRDKVLMVGDNLDSDILGALNADLHACWINYENKPAHETIAPHYTVNSLHELKILLNSLMS